MSTPTKENISLVVNGFEQFFEHMLKSQSFNLQEFVNFMEPRFTAAGYRSQTDYTLRDKSGGNILILTEIGAGDFIVATGAIREVRRIYPDAHITLLVYPNTLELAEYCPYVDEVIVSSREACNNRVFEFYKVRMDMASLLLEKRYDLCFSFVIHPHSFLLMYMSGARLRISAIDHETFNEFNESNGLTELFMRLATHLFPYNTYGYHRADRFFSLLENLLLLPITNRETEVWCTAADVEVAKDCLSGASSTIYSLNMGGFNGIKHYPPEKYARFLELILREEPTATFVILGGGQNDLNSAAIIKKVAPNVYANNIIDLTNKISYRQSAAVLSFCQIHIGNDTGTIHLAAAVSCPVLELNCFPADLTMHKNNCPPRWYPYGVPNVIIQPEHALPECRGLYAYRGCATNFPHCITQIEPQTLLRGFHLLKERIEAKICEPLYIH